MCCFSLVDINIWVPKYSKSNEKYGKVIIDTQRHLPVAHHDEGLQQDHPAAAGKMCHQVEP